MPLIIYTHLYIVYTEYLTKSFTFYIIVDYYPYQVIFTLEFYLLPKTWKEYLHQSVSHREKNQLEGKTLSDCHIVYVIK